MKQVYINNQREIKIHVAAESDSARRKSGQILVGGATMRMDDSRKSFFGELRSFESGLRFSKIKHGPYDLGDGFMNVFDNRVSSWGVR